MKLVAALLVKNELAALPRILEDVRELVDEVLVVDTGSTDGTLELVGELGLLCYQRPWVGFAHNRTELLELARGHGDWILMLDADMRLQVTGDRPHMGDGSQDAYRLAIVEGATRWRLPLLTKSTYPWRYEGVTHAYLAGGGKRADSDWLTIDGGGGTTPEKLLRDLELLGHAVAQDPLDSRSTFYLARTLDDLDRPVPAMYWYQRRLELGGYADELYFSRLRLGALIVKHVSFHTGALTLLEAWREHPHRAEALRALAHAADSVADKIPMPSSGLFVDMNQYADQPSSEPERTLPA